MQPKFVAKEICATADVSRGLSSWGEKLRYFVSVVLTLAAAYIFLGWLGQAMASFVPDRWEAKLVAFDIPDVLDPPEETEALFKRLVSEAELRPLHYRLVLLPNDDPNAFAFLGGVVGITTGMLREVTSEVGLAMVLAHELGHIQNRHVLKQMGRTLILDTCVFLLFGSEASSIVEQASDLESLSWSRNQEFEADQFGLELITRVFEDTDDALEFFEDMLRLAAESGGEGVGFLSTHPLAKERLQRMQELRVELQR